MTSRYGWNLNEVEFDDESKAYNEDQPRDDYGRFGSGSSGDRPSHDSIAGRLSAIDARQEDVNDSTMDDTGYEDNPHTMAATREYNALEAIATVLRNQQVADKNTELHARFDYVLDDSKPGGVAAAAQSKMDGKDLELMWVGSLQKGAGTNLIKQQMAWGRAQGAEHMTGIAKWGSLPYYVKTFGAVATDKEDPITEGTPFKVALEKRKGDSLAHDQRHFAAIVKSAHEEHEPDLKRSLLHAWAVAKSSVPRGALQSEIRNKNWEGIVQLLERAQKPLLEAATVPRLASGYLRGVELGARPLRRLGVTVRAPQAVSTVSMNPRALSYARARAGVLLPDSAAIKRQVTALVTEALEEGYTTEDLADRLADVVGLDARRVGALAEYAKDATQAETRAYRDELIQNRAETISRTEVMAASNAGQQGIWMSALDQGLVDADMRKIWIATDGCCDECEALEAQDPVAIDDDFDDDVTFPPLHPNCRCTMGLVG